MVVLWKLLQACVLSLINDCPPRKPRDGTWSSIGDREQQRRESLAQAKEVVGVLPTRLGMGVSVVVNTSWDFAQIGREHVGIRDKNPKGDRMLWCCVRVVDMAR